MINDLEKKECFGCNACADACPVGAISYIEDMEGFLYPNVNDDICIQCNLCEKVCPAKNPIYSCNKCEEILCLAANHKHLDIRFDSTSGGVFTALAEPFLANGGYVGGAVYTDEWKVKQIITNDLQELPKLRSSKYIQSNSEGFYKKAKDLLEKGEKVLLVGLPCQMAAVRTFLGKEYENLLIVDLICRYINSPYAYARYLEYLEREYKSQIVYIKPKNKEMGWRKLTHKVVFKNESTYYGTYDTDKFMQASMKTNCLSRPSCYECKFKGFPRYADITLGDYWVKDLVCDLDDDTGTSIIILNNKKGEAYYNRIKKYLKSEEVSLDSVVEGNPALTKSLPREKINRSEFFERVHKEPFDKVVDDMCAAPRLSTKRKIKNILSVFYKEFKYAKFHPWPWYQFFAMNFIHPAVKATVSQKKVIYTTPHCLFEIDKGASIELNGFLVFGNSPFKHSKNETRIRMQKGAKLIIGDLGEGGYGFGYGSDIEIFENATLESKGGPSTNMNTTIICQNKIVIGQVVAIGRNVTIRDNNGGHLININGYNDSRPVIIGEHVWLCEGVTVLAGVKIGDGTIVGAGSVVNKSLPRNVTAFGNPVKIGTEGIEWKM